MAYQKKLVVIKPVENGQTCGGVLKMELGSQPTGTLSLAPQRKTAQTLLLEADGNAHTIRLSNTTFPLPFTTAAEVSCLLLEEDKPIAYGSTSSDKIYCLMLQNKYYKVLVRSADEEGKFEPSDDESAPSASDFDSENAQEEQPSAPNDEDIKPKNRASNEPEDKQTNRAKEPTQLPTEKSENEPIATAKTDNNVTSRKHPVATKRKTVEVDASAAVKQTSSDTKIPTFVLDEGVEFDGTNFYAAVKPQLDEMFVCYPSFEPLCNAIEYSHWIRIDVDDDYYVVGVIFDEEGNAQKIAYGIHGSKHLKPPEEVRFACKWFALPDDDEGFWLIMQDALTGRLR